MDMGFAIIGSLARHCRPQSVKLSSMLGTPKKRGGVFSAPQGIRKKGCGFPAQNS
jgi:hypothetical protein